MTELRIGVDIGGTKIAAGLVDGRGLIEGTRLTVSTPALDGPNAIVDAVGRLVHELDGVANEVVEVGVGTAGVVDSAGVILSATDAIFGWQGFDLRGALTELLSRPAVVLNDVHAAAVGEARLGAGRSSPSFLMVTVGTGVGGAVFRDRRLELGATGTAGLVGHTAARNQRARPCTCGQSGHIEAYASGPAMERDYASATGRALILKDIAALALGDNRIEPDAEARRVVLSAAKVLGVGLADALNLLDVHSVIIGGGVASIGDLYLDAVKSAFAAAALPGPATAHILPAVLGPDATLVGAGLYSGTPQ